MDSVVWSRLSAPVRMLLTGDYDSHEAAFMIMPSTVSVDLADRASPSNSSRALQVFLMLLRPDVQMLYENDLSMLEDAVLRAQAWNVSAMADDVRVLMDLFGSFNELDIPIVRLKPVPPGPGGEPLGKISLLGSAEDAFVAVVQSTLTVSVIKNHVEVQGGLLLFLGSKDRQAVLGVLENDVLAQAYDERADLLSLLEGSQARLLADFGVTGIRVLSNHGRMLDTSAIVTITFSDAAEVLAMAAYAPFRQREGSDGSLPYKLKGWSTFYRLWQQTQVKARRFLNSSDDDEDEAVLDELMRLDVGAEEPFEHLVPEFNEPEAMEPEALGEDLRPELDQPDDIPAEDTQPADAGPEVLRNRVLLQSIGGFDMFSSADEIIAMRRACPGSYNGIVRLSRIVLGQYYEGDGAILQLWQYWIDTSPSRGSR